jgi:dynein assembly factor with WDR repeat domains 1
LDLSPESDPAVSGCKLPPANWHPRAVLTTLWSQSVFVKVVVTGLLAREPMLSENRRPLLLQLISKLQAKLAEAADQSDFRLHRVIDNAHVLPLTNCAFNKSGDRFITGSYDQTCKVWNTFTGEQLQSLEGHTSVVYALAFNNPYGDTVVTGSFDKTAKLWNASTGTHHEPH